MIMLIVLPPFCLLEILIIIWTQSIDAVQVEHNPLSSCKQSSRQEVIYLIIRAFALLLSLPLF